MKTGTHRDLQGLEYLVEYEHDSQKMTLISYDKSHRPKARIEFDEFRLYSMLRNCLEALGEDARIYVVSEYLKKIKDENGKKRYTEAEVAQLMGLPSRAYLRSRIAVHAIDGLKHSAKADEQL